MTIPQQFFDLQNEVNNLAPGGQPMPGPATLLYNAVGPVGWTAFAVLVILSPTIFMKYIWPRLLPIIEPYIILLYLFVDEFEDEEKKSLRE